MSLKEKDIQNIRDAHLQAELYSATYGLAGKEYEEAMLRFKHTHKHFKGIRHVRMVETLTVIPIKDKSGKIYKGYKGDSNYRYDVWETLDGKWHSDVVSTFDMHQPNWHSQFHAKNPTAKKVLSLQQNDMIAFEDENKGYTIGRIVKFD